MAKINANNQRTSWQYDEANHKINEYDADGGTRTMTYDGVGSLKSNIDPRNQGASNMGYDANNRLTGESFTDGTNHSYGYDNVGNRLTMGDSTGMTTFTYTARNELQTTQVPAGGMMTHSYDAAGRRTNMHDYSGGMYTYQYDQASRQTQIINPRGQTTTHVYDSLNRLMQRQYANAAEGLPRGGR
jgi:YD repeat-containing protein